MSVHQCPRCELRFADMPELVGHLIDDHEVAPETIERHLSGLTPGVHPHRRPPDVTHVDDRKDWG